VILTRKSLVSELESALKSGSKDDRVRTLRRITDLFLSSSDQLSNEQIDVFDEVLGHLIRRVENKALVELSQKIAPVENAPPAVSKELAYNDEIAAAAPILTFSKKLTSADLVDIARLKGHGHLLAIANRKEIDAKITDVLIDRGDREIHNRIAGNAGARFSDEGMTLLVQSAKGDTNLFCNLGSRSDLPMHLFQRLLENADQADCEKLMLASSADHQEEIRSVLRASSASLDMPHEEGDFIRATNLINKMRDDGELDEIVLLEFSKENRHPEMVVALSNMCEAPHELIDNIMQGNRGGALLVPARAAGISWVTLKSLIESRWGSSMAPQSMEALKKDYSRLSVSTAQRVLKIWCKQWAAGLFSQIQYDLKA
jgi:uncharacterized protein (DUF2336 family)